MKISKRAWSIPIIIILSFLLFTGYGRYSLLKKFGLTMDSYLPNSLFDNSFPYDSIRFEIDVPYHEHFDDDLDSLFGLEVVPAKNRIFAASSQAIFSPAGGVKFSTPFSKESLDTSRMDFASYEELEKRYEWTSDISRSVIDLYFALYEESYFKDKMYGLQFYFWYLLTGNYEKSSDETSIEYLSNEGFTNVTIKRNFFGYSSATDSSIIISSHTFTDSLSSNVVEQGQIFTKDGLKELELRYKVNHVLLDSLFLPRKFIWSMTDIGEVRDTVKTGGYIYISNLKTYGK